MRDGSYPLLLPIVQKTQFLILHAITCTVVGHTVDLVSAQDIIAH